MDRKSVLELEMKSVPANFTARTGLLVVVAVFGICSFFLLCNYLLLNQRIGAMEEKLETLPQRSERLNPNVSSSDDEKEAKQVLHAREKRSVSLLDLEKRLRYLEKRYLVLHSSNFFSGVGQVTVLRLFPYHTVY